MSYTKGDIRNLVKIQVLTYNPTIQLDERTIDFCVYRAEMEVYKWYLNVQEEIFRTTFSFGDGAALPARFDTFANRATGANAVTATWLAPENVPFRRSNALDLATVTSPSYYIGGAAGLAVRVIPDSETLSVDCYLTPLALWPSSVSLSTASTMPDELKYLVMLSAALKVSQTLKDQASQLGLTDIEVKNADNSVEVFGKMYTEQQMLEDRLG